MIDLQRTLAMIVGSQGQTDDPRFPDSKPRNLARLHKTRARRRAASKRARAARRRNR